MPFGNPILICKASRKTFKVSGLKSTAVWRRMKKPLQRRILKIACRTDKATCNRLLLTLLNNKLIKEFGVMTSIFIDSKSKSIAIELDLKGEDRPVSIKINGYVVEPKGDGSLVKIGDISFSREWMDVIFKKLIADGISIPIAPDLLEQIL